VRQFALGQFALAIHVVQNLEARLRQPGRVQDPRDESLCFLGKAGINESAQRQRRIAQPAVPVVPVPDSTR
jgi:hypothetical protein